MRPYQICAKSSSEPPLSDEDLIALQEACGPVGLLRFPPIDSIRTLRRQGYVTIVLGGVQITPAGLERLLRERKRECFAAARQHTLSVG